jgi:hypothetical protein
VVRDAAAEEVADEGLDGVGFVDASFSTCSSIGGRANSRLARLFQFVRGESDPAEVPTACSKNASVWQMNGSNSGSSASPLGSST